jgi:hypothetical protein
MYQPAHGMFSSWTANNGAIEACDVWAKPSESMAMAIALTTTTTMKMDDHSTCNC